MKKCACGNAIWDDVTGTCEACYDELCNQNAQIKTPQMDTTTWKKIIGDTLQKISAFPSRKKRNGNVN